MKRFFYLLLVAVFASVFITSCKQEVKPKNVEVKVPTKKRSIPRFNHDSAYVFVERQVALGPRYPGTDAHAQLIEALSGQLEQYADKVYEQDFSVDFLDEQNVDATNIIASFNPNVGKRVLLAAHFDTRKIAEKDDDVQLKNKPILGADDGASGVGVLLEIARLIKENGLDIGVDIVLFDAEDNGDSGTGENWCLGAKHWSKTPHIKGYRADFGILLDMVGAKGAQFGKEQISTYYAGNIQQKVWQMAQSMGYGDYFMNFPSGPIEDDHKYVNENLGIPMIDIINTPLSGAIPEFGHYHHTHKDDMSIIDKNTLKVVGRVVTAVVYNYNNGSF